MRSTVRQNRLSRMVCRVDVANVQGAERLEIFHGLCSRILAVSAARVYYEDRTQEARRVLVAVFRLLSRRCGVVPWP